MKATLLLPLLLVFVTSEKCCPLHKVVMLRNEERDVLNLFPKGREIWECPTWATLFCLYVFLRNHFSIPSWYCLRFRQPSPSAAVTISSKIWVFQLCGRTESYAHKDLHQWSDQNCWSRFPEGNDFCKDILQTKRSRELHSCHWFRFFLKKVDPF